MTRRVLLIDDDRLQFKLTQALFQSLGPGAYELDWAGTYNEGLERLVSGGYAVCLLDFQLGDRDGLQLIREAIARGCRTPIVFLTAESAESVDIEAMEAGALDYLVKGEINPRLLGRSLRYALKLGDSLEALRRLATRDELTGLLNRREFDRILAEETERAGRFGHALGLVMVDLDHFKSVNDTHGHPVGDIVLRETAKRLASVVRSVDRVARYGGEEFALILLQTDAEGTLEIARKVCAGVRCDPIVTGDGQALPITVSAGAAALPGIAMTGAALVAAADRALYVAKGGGRNRAEIAREGP